ncbi:hypothetical protein SLUN_00315 [Streptomyces lunaelactis]|uniref:Uncharacterized protein n=1 Tax=Streptomyces lunaelactis TaxID=1535768 RepID=A0A2R4SVP5_9ACTN|nr:hypothetical protein [Streptomyces lunaelactis]AVZ70940.1 hypothetical protein SLUN_00315 [Streptomyces lunaelactis]NUK27623.1 hypothetical protein [Streptomyces lunaelactis]NUK88087.1 hypothetical protein [Streptomyces lunaelactis]
MSAEGQDILAPALEAAGIIGNDGSRYEDDDFNLGGEETIRIIIDHFSLPRLRSDDSASRRRSFP